MKKKIIFNIVFNVFLVLDMSYVFAADVAVVDPSLKRLRFSLPSVLSDDELAQYDWLPMDSPLKSFDRSTSSPDLLKQIKTDPLVAQRFDSLVAKGQDLVKKFSDFEQKWKKFLDIDNVGSSSTSFLKVANKSFQLGTIDEMFEIFKNELRPLNTSKESYFKWVLNFFNQLKHTFSLGKDFEQEIDKQFDQLGQLRTDLRDLYDSIVNLTKKFTHWENYWKEQASRTFDSYNKSDELVSGYLYLQHPNMNYIAKPAQKLLSKQSLSLLDKWYINLATWMHHEMKALGVYKLIQSPVTISWSKPISLKNGKIITFPIQVKHWNLIHTFLGELKGGANFTGMHLNDDRLFNTFYSPGTVPNQVTLTVPATKTAPLAKLKTYSKISTLFPANWNMYTCVDAAIYALQNIESIEPGSSGYGAENLIIRGRVKPIYRGVESPYLIEIAVNPQAQEVVSFYPISDKQYQKEQELKRQQEQQLKQQQAKEGLAILLQQEREALEEFNRKKQRMWDKGKRKE